MSLHVVNHGYVRPHQRRSRAAPRRHLADDLVEGEFAVAQSPSLAGRRIQRRRLVGIALVRGLVAIKMIDAAGVGQAGDH